MNDITKLISVEFESIEDIISKLLDGNDVVTNKIKGFLHYPSKRIRTILPLLYLKSNCCAITKDILNIIAAGEIFHNASLLHDDVIDDAKFRRENPVIACQLSPKMSIIAGDLLVSKAVKLILNTKRNNITDYFLSCVETMCDAEINQYILRGTQLDFEQYINICKGKTSNLFITSLKSVSEICGLDINIAENFAEIFGIVFQIRNDFEPKSVYEDDNNGIYTIRNIIDIEKINILIDNYKEMMGSIIKGFPDNIYTQGLYTLVNKL